MFFLSSLFIFICPQDSFPKNTAIKIGVSSMITPVDAVKYYQDVIDYIGEEIKHPVQMVQEDIR